MPISRTFFSPLRHDGAVVGCSLWGRIALPATVDAKLMMHAEQATSWGDAGLRVRGLRSLGDTDFLSSVAS